MNIHPIVGLLVPYESAIAPTDLMQFHNIDLYIHGLCRIVHEGRAIEIVSVVSEREGQGNFSEFVDKLIESYQGVVFWEIWSEKVKAGLSSRGFRPVTKVEDVRIYGMGWIAENAPIWQAGYPKEISYGIQNRTGRAPKAFKKVLDLIREEQCNRLSQSQNSPPS